MLSNQEHIRLEYRYKARIKQQLSKETIPLKMASTAEAETSGRVMTEMSIWLDSIEQ